MGKQKLSPLATALKSNPLKAETKSTVALSWDEIASTEFQTKGAEAANQSVTTAQEDQYLQSVIQKQKQFEIEKQRKINLEAKEVQEKTHQELEDKKAAIAKQKAELLKQTKKVVPGTKDMSGNTTTNLSSVLTPEQRAQYQALLEQENLLTEEASKVGYNLKNNPETQKKIDYTKKQKEKFLWKRTTYTPIVKDMGFTLNALSPGGFVAPFVSGLVTDFANWTDELLSNSINSNVDEEKEVSKRASLPESHPEYINKKEYYEGKKLSEKVDNSILLGEKLKQEKFLERLEKTLPSEQAFNLSTFSSEKINHTFLKNRIERTIENIDAAIEKKSGLDNYVTEIFGKTIINPVGTISFLENVRSNQYDFFWGQDAEENLNEKLATKAKEKKVKDMSLLKEEDFLEVYNTLDPMEKLAIETKYSKLISDSVAEDHLSYSYKTVKNTGASADFIVSLLATRGVGKLIGYGLKGAVPALRTATATEGGFLARTLTNKGMSAKTAEMVIGRGKTLSNVVGQGTAITYINPAELTGPRYSKYKSIDDKEGNAKAVFSREGAYALVKKETEKDKEAFTKVYDHLKTQEASLDEEGKNLLKYLSGSLGYTENETYVNDKGETVAVESLEDKLKAYEVNSKAYIHLRGVTSNIIETGTEVYTGKVLKYLGGKAGEATNYIAEKVPFANKVLVSASGKIDNLQKWYATSKVGRLKRDYDFATGKYFGVKQDIIQSVPEEIIEEYAAAASNFLVDWDATEIKEAFTMDFLGEVSAQTLLLNGTMKAGGAGATMTKRLYGNLYDRKLQNIEKEIEKLNSFLEQNPGDSDTLLSIKNLTERKENIQKNASLTGLGLSKKINKKHDAYSNTKRYLDKSAGIRRAIDSLKGANTDEDLNKILDLLDTTNSNDNARIRESFMLRQTGRVAEAEALEAAMDSSTLMNAILTGNEKDLQGALSKVLKDSNREIKADQKQRITNLSETIDEVIRFKEDNKATKGNLQLAIALKAKQLSAKKAKEVILNQRTSIAEGAIREFETMFDQYFSNSGLDKAEATQAFITGSLIDKNKFHPVIEKANTLGLKGFIGYTYSFLREEGLTDSLNSLDLAIAETLNPPTHLVERDAFNEEFISKFNDLYQGKVEDLSDLGITDVTFNEDRKVIFTPKLYNEILDKLSEKYVAENRLTKQQMAEVKLKSKNLVEAFLSKQDKQNKLREALEKQMQQNLEVKSEEDTEETEEAPIVIVDADSFVDTQTVVSGLVTSATPEPTPVIVVNTTPTVSNQSEIQAKQDEVARLRAEEQVEKADIERKRQEELDKVKRARKVADFITKYELSGYGDFTDPDFNEQIKRLASEKINAKYNAEEKELYKKYDKVISPLLNEIDSLQAATILASQDSLLDDDEDTGIPKAANQEEIPDLSIELTGDNNSEETERIKAENTEIYVQVLNHILPKIREALDYEVKDIVYVLEEILNVLTPKESNHLSLTVGGYIRAWKKLGLPITDAQAQQVNRMAKAKFAPEVLSGLHSIFENVVTENELTPATEYDTLSEEVNEKVTEVKETVEPVVELTPKEIQEAPLNLEELEEKKLKDLEQEVLSGKHPLSAKVLELTELGVDFWEAYNLALNGVTEGTTVVKEDANFYFTPFLGFNALPYEWYTYTDEKGVERLAKRTTEKAQLNVSQNDRFIRPDFRDLLHPDKYLTGNEFNIEVAKEEDWDNIIYQEITSETEMTLPNGKVIPAGTKTVISFADFMKSQPASFRNSESFKDIVPTFITDASGKRLAYIHTLDWYTPNSIPNPNPKDESTASEPSEEWVEHIEKYKEGTRRLRNAIAKGLTKISIEKPAEGKAGMLASSETRISVQESNPQATLTVQRGGTMRDFLNGLVRKDPEFATGTKVLVNDPKEFTSQKNKSGEIVNPDGHTWAIYRVGSKPHPTKPGAIVKTYRAIRLGRNIDESQIENARWAIAAHKILNGKSSKPGYELTIEEAKQIAQGINTALSIDISKFEDLGSFIRMFFKIEKSFIQEYQNKVNEKKEKEGKEKVKYDVRSTAPYLEYLFEKEISSIELLGGLNDRADKKPVISQHTNDEMLLAKGLGAVPKINPKGSKIVEPYTNAKGKPLTYEEYLKETLYTNYKAFDMDTTGKSPAYSLTVQPKILIHYNNEDIDGNKAIVSSTEVSLQEKIEQATKESLQEIQETPKALTEEDKTKGVAEIEDLLKKYKIDFNLFLESDDSVGSLEELKKLYDLTADLSVNQQKVILGQIVAEINSLLGFKAKINSKSVTKIKNEVKATLNLKLRERLAKLEEAQTFLTSNSINTPEGVAMVKAIEDSIKNIMDIQKEYNSLFDRAFKDALLETRVTEVEDQKDTEEGDLEKEKNFSKESVEEKLKDKASSQIRMMMHSIPMFNDAGEIVTGYLDLPSYMSLNDTYNLVLRTVSANIDTKADFNQIMDKLSKSEHPAIKMIIARLEGADQQVKNQFVYNITAHALSSKFVMYENKKGKVSLKLYDTNSSQINRQIKQKWIENSRFTELYQEDGSFNTVYAQKLINEFESFGVNPAEASEEKLRAWLGKLGIVLHNKTWEKLYTQGYKKGDTVTSFYTLVTHKKLGLYPNLITFLKNGIADTEENYRANTPNDILSNIGGISNTIALIEADYNPELISLSYQDNGKSIFTLTPPKYITERVTSLITRVTDPETGVSRVSDLVLDLLEVSYNKNSMLLQVLNENPELSELLAVHHVSLGAIKDKDKKDSQGKITELSALDYDMFALGGLQDRRVQNFSTKQMYGGIPLRIANMLSSTKSDKDTGLFMTVPVFDLLRDANYSFYKDENGELKMTDKLSNALIDLVVRPELERIINFNQNVKKTGIKNYDTPARLFHFIPALNSLQIKGRNLADYLNSEEAATENADQILKLIEVEVKDRLQRVITSEANAKTEAWKELGLVTKGKSKDLQNKIFNEEYFTEKGIDKNPVKDFDLGVMDFVINSFVFQAEYSKVFSGDIAQFSQDKVWKKAIERASNRDKVEHTAFTLSTEDYVKINKEIGTNLGKRLAYEVAPGKQGAVTEENRFYNQIFLQDSVDIAENTLDLIEMYEGLAARNKSKKTVLKYKALKKALGELEDKTSLSEKEMVEMQVIADEIEKIRESLSKSFPSLADYFNIESTDAQEYTTVTEHLQILNSMGRVTKEQYNRIITALASNSSLEEADLKIVMQPIKPMHGGSYVMKEADVERVIYIKSSSFPLIPELTRGTSLDKLRVAMEKLETETGRFTRASYQSANKVGASVNPINPTDALSLETLFNYKDNANTDPSSPMLVLDRNNFRIQQDVPFKSGKAKMDTVSMGTQIFKMLFSNGVVSAKNTFMYKGKKIDGQKLYEIYESTFSKIIDYETNKLYKDLGLDAQGKVVDQKMFMTKLRDVLEEEAIGRGYSLREIRNLQLVELMDINSKESYHDFKTPLWLSSNSNKYEALLNSIITNRIMQFKMPGNSFIAGSENGFRFSESMSSLSSAEQSKTIYLSGWNGQELQGTHFTEEGGNPVFTSAQVMVTSKIKGANNKLIDLFEGYNSKTGDVSKAKYVKRNENGTLGLKEEMLDKELLKMFSFRTPTSSHISGSSIEIVGILPPSCGDLMLVPKNFTKQKGLDFDIDKEGAYSFNHYLNEKGEIKILDEQYLEEVRSGDIRVSLINTPDFDAAQYYQSRRTWFSDRRKELKTIKTLKNAVRNRRIIQSEIEDLNFILSVKGKNKITDEETIAELELLIDQAQEDLEIVEEVIVDIEKTSRLNSNFNSAQYEAERERLTQEYEVIHSDLEKIYFQEIENQHVKLIEKKIAQNDFTRVYLSVYDSPTKEVQKKLNSILSMEVASDQATKLASWKEEGVKNKFILKQKQEGKNSQEAEMAYKEYLENFTMLSYSYQKSKMDLGAIGKKAIGVYATAATFAALIQTKHPNGMNMETFTIGNMSSSKLGAVNSLSKKYQRTLSDILGERINTATDNEKEQILGRVGVDDMTIGTDSFLALAGFDLGESGNSISYMLLSQPAVVEFNRKIKESKGIIGKWIDEKKLISEMIEKLTENESEKLSYVKNPDKGTWHFIETSSLGLRKELKRGSEVLTEQVLEQGIKKGEVSGKEQAHALMTYIQARDLANRLTPMVSALNTNSLGKSIPEAMLKHAKMGRAMFSQKPLFEGFINLIGEEVYTPEEGFPFEVTNAEGLTEVHYVKPTTPQGKIAATGLHLGKTLFENLFVYNDADIKEVMNQILAMQEIDEDRVAPEDLEFIVQEFKKFLFSNPKLTGNFEDASLKRYELVQDTAQNESLAKYVHSLFKNTDVKYAKGIEAIKNNPLVGKRLMYKVGKGEEEISTITFNNSSTDSLSDEELYLSLPSLMLDNLPLPNRNGKPYTTQDLVQDLVIYAFLEGGIQKATQFIKFIPIELQAEIGKVNPKTGAFISINDQLQNYNPRRIPISMKKDVFGINELGGFVSFFFQNNPTEAPRISYEDATLDVSETSQSLTLSPERRAISTPKIVHFIDRNKNLYLLKHVGAGNYVGMDYNKLSKSTSQYSKGGSFESVKGQQLKERVVEGLFKDVTHDFKIQEKMTLEEALDQIASIPLNKNREYLSQLAALFKLNIDADKTFSVKAIGSRGKAVSGNVIMDLNYLLSKNTSNELIAETIVHEVVHSLTVKELDKYFHFNRTTNSYELVPEYATGEFPLPTHVTQLNATYKAFLNSSLIDVKRLETLKEYMKKIKDSAVVGENVAAYTKELEKMFTPEEFKIYYAAINIKEFMATLFESAEFRQQLDAIEYKGSGQSILEKIADALIKILNSVFPGLRDNYLAKEALLASFRFMEVERKFSVEKDNSVSLTNKDLDSKYDSSFSLDKDRKIPDSALEISQEEWDSLTEEEKQRIKDCI